MKKLFTVLSAVLILSSCAVMKGKQIRVQGEQELTVKMFAKRGAGGLVRFKEIPGTFPVTHTRWAVGEKVKVNFGNKPALEVTPSYF